MEPPGPPCAVPGQAPSRPAAAARLAGGRRGLVSLSGREGGGLLGRATSLARWEACPAMTVPSL